MAPEGGAEQSWYTNMGGSEGLGSLLGGVGSLGTLGLGVANYFQGKSQFDYSKDVAAKNAEQQRNSQLMGMQNQMQYREDHGWGGFNQEQQRLYNSMRDQQLS